MNYDMPYQALAIYMLLNGEICTVAMEQAAVQCGRSIIWG